MIAPSSKQKTLSLLSVALLVSYFAALYAFLQYRSGTSPVVEDTQIQGIVPARTTDSRPTPATGIVQGATKHAAATPPPAPDAAAVLTLLPEKVTVIGLDQQGTETFRDTRAVPKHSDTLHTVTRASIVYGYLRRVFPVPGISVVTCSGTTLGQPGEVVTVATSLERAQKLLQQHVTTHETCVGGVPASLITE